MATPKATTATKAAKATTTKAPTARQQAKAIRDADRAAQVKAEQAITARGRRNVAAAKATTTKAPAAKAANGRRKATTTEAPARKVSARAAAAANTDTAHTVAQVVRAAREAAGLSTKELAERMATSDGAVRRIEDARTNCTAATLANIAQALGKQLVISFA